MDNMSNFVILYKVNIMLNIGQETISVPTSDIVSIAIVDEFDTMTHQMIRVRLYTDIDNFESMTNKPDDIHISLNMPSGVYRINDEDKSPTMVSPSKFYPHFESCTMKAYIEQKNSPTSKMDQYVNGIKKESDLNNNIKVPIELYCYNQELIHKLKQKTSAVFKNMTLSTAVNQILTDGNIRRYSMDIFDNQTKYDQILIPNLSITNSLSFLDEEYGLYAGGGQLYCDMNQLRLCNTISTPTNNSVYPIYVSSAKSNKDLSGVIKFSDGSYQMSTLAGYVSVLSQSDIDKVLNSEQISSVNIETWKTSYAKLKVFSMNKSSNPGTIFTPDYLHKTKNEYIAAREAMRINERITRVDVSGTGFPIEAFLPSSRFNLIFESAIRGINMNDYYRPTFTCHVLTNLDSDLFIAQTTMNLCTN